MALYGYARCSTDETRQDVTRQRRELQALGVEKNNIYLEYGSGTKTDRIELNKLLNIVKEGDTICATEPSRITRSTKQLCEIIELAKDKKLKLVFGAFVVDCTSKLDVMTEGMLKMMGVFSELERNMISERVKSGVANARAKGKRVGRPELTINDVPDKVKTFYELYKDKKLNKTEFSQVCGVSRPTLNKYLEILEG